eukprot:g80033.t1
MASGATVALNVSQNIKLDSRDSFGLCGGTVQVSIDVRLEHPTYAVQSSHCFLRTWYKPLHCTSLLQAHCPYSTPALGSVFGLNGDMFSITPAVPGQQSFRHEHARQFGTFTSTWVISCMFMCLSRLSTKGFVDADSVEVGTCLEPCPAVANAGSCLFHAGVVCSGCRYGVWCHLVFYQHPAGVPLAVFYRRIKTQFMFIVGNFGSEPRWARLISKARVVQRVVGLPTTGMMYPAERFH